MTIYQVYKVITTSKATLYVGRDNDGQYRTGYEFFQKREDAERRAEYLRKCADDLNIECSFSVSEIEVG